MIDKTVYQNGTVMTDDLLSIHSKEHLLSHTVHSFLYSLYL